MAAANITLIKKLQKAINSRGEKILYNTSQWYSDKQQRPITVYHIKKSVWDEEKQKSRNIELFKAYSTIQVLLFLRDYWYQMNNIPIPEDNEVWNEIKSKNGGEGNEWQEQEKI